MRNVVFVAPFFLETTLRFVDAVGRLPEVSLGLISQDPVDRLPEGIRARLAAHQRVRDGIDAQHVFEGLEALGRQMGPTHCLLGTLEELQVPLGRIRDETGIPGMGAEAAENFRDKARMKDVLRRAGVPCARHQLVESAEEALGFAAVVGYPLVVKPPAGSGARSTIRVEEESALRVVLESMRPSAGKPALVEEFIQGEEHSFDSVFIDGRLAWYSVNHYEPGPLGVLEHAWIQWCVLSPREIDHPRYHDIRDVAVRALGALGMQTGLSHMEWFRRKDGTVAISEVGARPPGAQFTTLISYAQDIDLYQAWARLMVFGEFAAPPRPFAAGAAYLRGQGRGRVRKIHGLDEAQRELGKLVVEARLPRLNQSPSGTYEGEGYVILRHPETEAVRAGLRSLVKAVQIELG